MCGSERPAPNSMDSLPDLGAVQPSGPEINKYHRMSKIHKAMFNPEAIGAKVLKPIMRAVNSTEPGKRALLKCEHMTKSAALGCATRGFFRIENMKSGRPDTFPTGLANRPSSVTDYNVSAVTD